MFARFGVVGLFTCFSWLFLGVLVVVVGERELVGRGVEVVAGLMAVSAKTAPKAKGVDNIVVKALLDRGELEKLAEKMEELAGEYGDFFRRDAENVRNSDGVIVIGARVVDLGLKTPPDYGVDVNVAMALVNLGIAVGSAVKTASLLNVDNRIMYSIGVAAKRMGIVDADYVLGIPLSVKGKNIFFDRKWPRK